MWTSVLSGNQPSESGPRRKRYGRQKERDKNVVHWPAAADYWQASALSVRDEDTRDPRPSGQCPTESETRRAQECMLTLRERMCLEERARDGGAEKRTRERQEEMGGQERRHVREERGKAEDTVRKTGEGEYTEWRAQHV
ncbi:hypothetical protein NDU88_002636 [Pleurodeles waltl]|uniref:Uncharacterized protein n=1 Tax=Pleurodeles waltl TaxID=8319 RepID=A0AAV7UBS0_PLEWA|nr:hypothetical protein NDU88_002636 [Pleurodeles waltl]